jgi:hypothetical protein
MRRLLLLAVWSAATFFETSVAKAPAPDQEPRYDPATLVDIYGNIQDIRDTGKSGPLPGIHLVIKTDSGTFDLYLGPSNFVMAFEELFQKGSRIEVIGSRVKSAGVDNILAREIRRSELTLYLRDKEGRPFWTR